MFDCMKPGSAFAKYQRTGIVESVSIMFDTTATTVREPGKKWTESKHSFEDRQIAVTLTLPQFAELFAEVVATVSSDVALHRSLAQHLLVRAAGIAIDKARDAGLCPQCGREEGNHTLQCPRAAGGSK